MRTFLLLLLALLVQGAMAEPRPRVGGVSSIRVANYNSPSIVVKDTSAIVHEMNELRRKASWRRGEAKLSCYSTVVFLKGEKRVAEFRVTPAAIVERPVEKAQGSYTLEIAESDIPELSRRLAEALPAKDCN